MSALETPLFIGINGGGTHTSLVLANRAAQILSRAESGPSNPNVVGRESAETALRKGLDALLQGYDLAQIVGVGVCMAGVGRPNDFPPIRAFFEGIFPGKTISIDNDAIGALIAGIGRKFGIVAISGTGSIVYGVDEQGQRARADGWGYFFDVSSGYAIACGALRMVMYQYDENPDAAPSPFATAILAAVGVPHPTDLVTWLYAPERTIDQIAALARPIIEQAEAGEDSAKMLMKKAGAELARATGTVARRLKLDLPPILLSGSIFKHSAVMREFYREALSRHYPKAQIIHRDHDPALGAAQMVMADTLL